MIPIRGTLVRPRDVARWCGRATRHTVPMLFDDLARASATVGATSKRSEKVAVLADLFARLPPDEVEAAVAFATGTTQHGRLGIGWATLHQVTPPAAATPSLTVAAVDRALARLASISGT